MEYFPSPNQERELFLVIYFWMSRCIKIKIWVGWDAGGILKPRAVGTE